MKDYTAVSLAELALPGKTAYGILDANTVGMFEGYSDVESGDTPEELAEKIGVEPKGLAETISNYIKYYNADGQIIPGLYAAGDVADVKLFGAKALSAACVYSKIAAESVNE